MNRYLARVLEQQRIPAVDLELIRRIGVPVPPGPGYALVYANGRFTFSPRGRRLFETALLLNGLPIDAVQTARTIDDLRQIQQQIRRVMSCREADAEELRRTGVVSRAGATLLEAFLRGTLKTIQTATAARLATDDCGPKIAPAFFKPRRTRIPRSRLQAP